ncbi:hypothetical protein FSHL1_012516 [Fusarium sambucinum]
MPPLSSESNENGMPRSRQDICDVSATNGGISIAGYLQNVTIGNDQQVILKDKIRSCRNAVFVSHPDIDRESLASAKGQRTPGTREWILETTHYQSWLAKEFPVLRISGGPGKGKTIIALFLTGEVERVCQQTGDRLLFYFCQFQDDRYNNPLNLLRNLIYQVLELSPDEPQVDEVFKYFETPEKTKSALGSLDCLWRVLEKLLSQPSLPTTFCIIDGIDECRSSETLTDKLYGYCTSSGQRNTESKLQLAILGRGIHEPGMSHDIKLDLDNDRSVSGDIERFIAYSLEPLMAIPGFAEIRPEIKEILSEKSKGTFLWVSFVIQELAKKRTCLQIKDAMKYLPTGLYPIFTRMLHGIDPEYHDTSAYIFKWVAFAERPLTLNELAAATCNGHGEADTVAIADRIEICRPFLMILDGFVEYAISHWSSHARLSAEETEWLSDLNRLFLQNPINRLVYLEKNARYLCESPIHLASRLGLVPWLELLYDEVNKGPRGWTWTRPWIKMINSKVGLDYKETPLVSAISGCGDETTIRFLLEHGSKSNEPDALFTAAYLDDSDAVRLLLQHGVKTETKDPIYKETPLICSTRKVSVDAARILLDHGANIEAKNAFGQTALLSAVFRCDKDMTQFLLDHGANIEAKTDSGQTAFVIAVFRHGEDTARLLLDHGANIKAIKDDGDIVILSAIFGHENKDTAQFLLAHGANIEAIKDAGQTALQLAVILNDKAMIQLLLDRGADVEATGDDNQNVLIYAARDGKRDIVQMLLSHGADVRSKNKFNMTALTHALNKCRESTVRSLLQGGAEINADIVAINGPSVFIATIFESQFVLQLLLENRACVNWKWYGTTPLISTICGVSQAVQGPTWHPRPQNGFWFFIDKAER